VQAHVENQSAVSSREVARVFTRLRSIPRFAPSPSARRRYLRISFFVNRTLNETIFFKLKSRIIAGGKTLIVLQSR
jgi:hypothetical protein